MKAKNSKDFPRLMEQLTPLGAHICQIYMSERERQETLRDFVGNGLQLGEQTLCFSEKTTDEVVDAFLDGQGVSLREAKSSGMFKSRTSRSFYLKDGVFDHDRVFQEWQDFYTESMVQGYAGVRAMGDMLPELEPIRGGMAIVLFETKLNDVFQHYTPTQVICQYDAHAFRASTIMGVLRAHPLILVGRKVHANPYFEPPAKTISH